MYFVVHHFHTPYDRLPSRFLKNETVFSARAILFYAIFVFPVCYKIIPYYATGQYLPPPPRSPFLYILFATQAKRLQQHGKKHESSLSAEREKYQRSLKQAVAAAATTAKADHRRETTAALAALSSQHDETLRRALEVKDLEQRNALRESEAAARDTLCIAEERAKASAEDRIARLTEEFSEERRRLQDATATAASASASAKRDAAVAARDTVARDAARTTAHEEVLRDAVSRERSLAREAHEREMERVKGEFLKRQEALQVELRELVEAAGAAGAAAVAREQEKGEALLEESKEEARGAVEDALRRKDREMAKALKVRIVFFNSIYFCPVWMFFCRMLVIYSLVVVTFVCFCERGGGEKGTSGEWFVIFTCILL